MPFILRGINIDVARREFDSLEAAIQAGREWGFEFAIDYDNRVAASWSTFGGLVLR